MEITFHVNGRQVETDVDALRPLSSVLRDELSMRGTKEGCGEGRCGACTVLVDGRTVASCIFPAGLAAGTEVSTVEGLAAGDALSALQAALLERGAVQCGACTPGVLMTLTETLERSPGADEEEIRHALAGNVCRCTGYKQIVQATLAVVGGEGR